MKRGLKNILKILLINILYILPYLYLFLEPYLHGYHLQIKMVTNCYQLGNMHITYYQSVTVIIV